MNSNGENREGWEAVDSAEPEAGDQRVSIGRYLAQQRRLRDMTIEDLSELTRIPLRSLARLEEGQFDENPDGFVRGFVRTVAEALGLDPSDTVARMLSEPLDTNTVDTSKKIPARRAALAVAMVVAVIGALVLGRAIWTGQPATRHDAEGVAPVYRLDPVRALAESTEIDAGDSREQGALPSVSSAPPEGEGQPHAPD